MRSLACPTPSSNYGCLGKTMQSPTLWLGIMGGVLMVICMIRGVKASILWGILLVTFVSWIQAGNAATYFGSESSIQGGEARYEYFLKGAQLPSVAMTGGKLDFSGLRLADTWVALITFLYLDFLDATSTMYALSGMIGDKVPGFMSEKGQWPRQVWTMCADGFAIIIGSTLGTSPLTVMAESSVGIREGGRTGITAIVIAIGFGISMFLAPIFASIPPYATGPAIIFVGALMMEHVRHIEWADVRQAIPAFLTILMMPLTYSVAYGIIAGIMSAILIWAICFAADIGGVLLTRNGSKTLRHAYLDNMSHFYLAFDREHVLYEDLPGYKPAPSRWETEGESHEMHIAPQNKYMSEPVENFIAAELPDKLSSSDKAVPSIF